MVEKHVKTTTTTTVEKDPVKAEKEFTELDTAIRSSIIESLGKYAHMTLEELVLNATDVHGLKTENGTKFKISNKRIKIGIEIKDKKKKEE